MQPTAMNAACHNEVSPINGSVHHVDAAEAREHRAADQIRKTDAAEAADAIDAHRSAAAFFRKIVRDQ